jgi:hypothetical protein
MRRGALLPLALVAAAALHAESWTTTKRVCREARDAHNYHMYEECAIDIFTLDPVGPTAGNISTGSGFGGGLRYTHAFSANNFFTAKGLYSLNSSYFLNGRYRLVFPPIRPIELKGPHGKPGPIDDTKANVDFNFTRFDLHTQDFYGLGPDSTLAGHAVYRQIQTQAGVNGYMPLPVLSSRYGIVGVLGELNYLQPITKGVSGSSLPSVDVRYGEAGAPASINRPDFLELGGGLSIRTPTTRPSLWEKHEAQITYQHYFDQGSSQYSFDRLEAWADMSATLLKKTGSNNFDQPWWKDAICMPNAFRHCEIGTFTVGGRVTTSYSSSGSSVPFYLQPTLGGADFHGIDTLRGLVDYRLRAPNRLLLQVDFDKPIAPIGIKGHPLGQYGLYAFFDAGNVSFTPTELLDNGMRTDVGIGASMAIQNKVVVRAYIGFGAGEGSHPNVKAANAF